MNLFSLFFVFLYYNKISKTKSIDFEDSFKLIFLYNNKEKNTNTKETEEINELYLSNLYHHNLLSPICIGSKKKCFNLELNFYSKYIWISSNSSLLGGYLPEKSSSYKDIEPFDNSDSLFSDNQNENQKIRIKGNYSKDSIKFSHNNYLPMNFIYADSFYNSNNKIFLSKGQIGLEKEDFIPGDNKNVNEAKLKNNDLSLISQLYEKDIIKTKNFAINIINNTCG